MARPCLIVSPVSPNYEVPYLDVWELASSRALSKSQVLSPLILCTALSPEWVVSSLYNQGCPPGCVWTALGWLSCSHLSCRLTPLGSQGAGLCRPSSRGRRGSVCVPPPALWPGRWATSRVPPLVCHFSTPNASMLSLQILCPIVWVRSAFRPGHTRKTPPPLCRV